MQQKQNNQNNKQQNNFDLVNQKILQKYKQTSISVIDVDGKQLGLMKPLEAIRIAEEKSLDLLVVSIQNNIPIAKILDYGKYRFEMQRKQKDNRKNNTIKVKEIKVKPLIGDHDLNVRVENAKKWLSQGNKVKFIIEARGRLSTRKEFIEDLYNKFIGLLQNKDSKIIITQANKAVNSFRYETIIETK